MPPLPPFLLLLLHSISMVASQPSVTPCPSCCPTPCGGVNVTYPFWIASTTNSNSFCGYPNFNLVCNDDTLLSFLFNEPYIVLGIDGPNRTISLRDARTSSELTDRCPKPSNTSVPSQFRFAKDAANLTYFFNCSDDSIDVGRIPCRKEKSHVLRSGEIAVAKLEGECEEKVMVPALKEAVDVEEDLGKAFLDVWKKGFRMEWDPLEDCRSCEESGGRCSFQYENRKGSSILCSCINGINVAECRNGGGHLNIHRKVIIAICALLAGFFLAIVAFYVWLKRRPAKLSISPSRNLLFRSETSKPASLVKDMESQSDGYFHTPIFTFEELEAATGRFDSCKELGKGGFGIVYKGVLKDGRVVAVKRLHERNYQRVQQFRNEVEILNRIRHPNLVSLYGCTTRDSRDLLLVYEYISNGTLADHLHGSRASERLLAWPIRLSIAADTAAALAYLHATEPQIIHRDVKTTNMLLDNGFHVKVADFGLSRAFPSPRTTHVSTAPQGTPGYVDPEYHQCYQLTDKSDVYSFGVVLVELISSKPAVDMDRPRSEINLSNMAIAKIPRGHVGELVDANLGYDTDPDVRRTIEAVAELAFRCLQPEKEMRPSMDEVRVTLKKLHNGDERRSSVGEKKARDDTRSLLKSPGVVSLSPDAVVHGWPSRSTVSAVGPY